MAAKPIRRSLLIHTVHFAEKQDDLGWGSEYAEPIELVFVRIEPKESLVTTVTGETIKSTTTLFHDSVHSTPCEFKLDSKIAFNNTSYTVKGVDYFYDNQRLHHREVRLV